MTSLDARADDDASHLSRLLARWARQLFAEPATGSTDVLESSLVEVSGADRIRCVDATALAMHDGAIGG